MNALSFSDPTLRLLDEILCDPDGPAYETEAFPETGCDARSGRKEITASHLETEDLQETENAHSPAHPNRRNADAA